MALDSLMRQRVRWAGETLRAFARSAGWLDSDYRIFHRVEEFWDRLEIILAVRGLSEEERSAVRFDALTFLSNHSSGDPSIDRAIGAFVVRTFDQLAGTGIFSLPPGFEEYEFPPSGGSGRAASPVTSTV